MFNFRTTRHQLPPIYIYILPYFHIIPQSALTSHVRMPPAKKPNPKRPWQDIAKEAQEYRDASLTKVPESLDLLTSLDKKYSPNSLPKNSLSVTRRLHHLKDFQITEMLPADLIKGIAKRWWSSVEVVSAFLRRAVLAQKLVRDFLPCALSFSEFCSRVLQ